MNKNLRKFIRTNEIIKEARQTLREQLVLCNKNIEKNDAIVIVNNAGKFVKDVIEILKEVQQDG